MRLKQDLVAALGEFVGTTLFLFFSLGCAKTAQLSQTTAQKEGLETGLNNQTIIYIAVGFGLSLLVNVWVFYRVTGGLFNPAVTLALYLIGGLSVFRACLLFVAQIAGGIAGAALVAALTPFGGVADTETKLGKGVNIGQGLFIEAFLTAMLVLTILFLAAEKHKSTYIAPIGIGLALLICHMFGIAWTGCGINPARSFGPSVVAGNFPGYHWIYWVGPFIGTLMAVGFYLMLKAFDYTYVVFGQDSTSEEEARQAKAFLEEQERLEAGKENSFFGSGAQRFYVIFHRKSRADGSREPVKPVKPEPLDPANKAMTTALKEGNASIVDLGGVLGAETDIEAQKTDVADKNTTKDGDATLAVPSMRPSAQNEGGLNAPGTDQTGLAQIPYTQRILS